MGVETAFKGLGDTLRGLGEKGEKKEQLANDPNEMFKNMLGRVYQEKDPAKRSELKKQFTRMGESMALYKQYTSDKRAAETSPYRTGFVSTGDAREDFDMGNFLRQEGIKPVIGEEGFFSKVGSAMGLDFGGGAELTAEQQTLLDEQVVKMKKSMMSGKYGKDMTPDAANYLANYAAKTALVDHDAYKNMTDPGAPARGQRIPYPVEKGYIYEGGKRGPLIVAPHGRGKPPAKGKAPGKKLKDLGVSEKILTDFMKEFNLDRNEAIRQIKKLGEE